MVYIPEVPCMLVPGPLWAAMSVPIPNRSGDLVRAMTDPRYIEQSGSLDLYAYR